MEYLEIIKIFGVWGLLNIIFLTIFLLIIKLFINNLFAKDYKKFEELHSRRIKIIDTTYKKLVAVEKTITHLVSFAGETDGKPASKEEYRKREDIKFNKFSDAMMTFINYVDYHQLYYNDDIIKILNEVKDYCLHNSIHFMFRTTEGNWDITFDERIKLQDEMAKKIPNLKNKLEILFKKIIGE